MPSSANKGFNLQVTGTNIGIWGTITNNNWNIVDNALGGTLNLDVSGNSDINLTNSQASYLIQSLTGVLTGSIDYIFPDAGGLYFITNGTTGNFTITANVATGSDPGIIIPQGQTVPVYVDASNKVVRGATGTQSVYSCGTVAGTANALIVATTTPAGFVLMVGTLVTFVPTASSTAAGPTLNISGTGAYVLQNATPSGLANIPPGSLAPGSPVLAQFNGTVWIALNVLYEGVTTQVSSNRAITVGDLWKPFVCTASLTLTLAHTTALFSFFYFDVNALGGAVTLTPNAGDAISAYGTTLSTGASFVFPQGTSGRVYTDANGNWFINNFYPVTDHGQCTLSLSGSNLILLPKNGNKIVINNVQRTIASGGVTLSPSGLAANTTYYIYAFFSGSNISMEASATAYAVSTLNGVTTKSGDATRTLVGMARTNASVGWVNSATQRFIRSYFNDYGIVGNLTIPNNIVRSSAAWGEFDASTELGFLLWSGEGFFCSCFGTAAADTPGNTGYGIGVNQTSGTPAGPFTGPQNFVANTGINISCAGVTSGFSEGYSYINLMGYAASGSITADQLNGLGYSTSRGIV